MRRHLSVMLLCAAALAAGAGACDDKPPGRGPTGDPDAGVKGKPFGRQAIDASKAANAAAAKLEKALAGRPYADNEAARADYFELRRAASAVEPYARLAAPMGTEVLFGPPRIADEAGGALALLDRALADDDRAQIDQQLGQTLRALRLIDHELALNELKLPATLRAVSEAAYELGLRSCEAYQGVPDAPESVLADIQGTLDAIEHGSRAAFETAGGTNTGEAQAALERVLGLVAKAREPIAAVKNSHELRRRLELVRMSGEMGVAVRALAAALGQKLALPYEARYPRHANDPALEAVSALTVPAARYDPRAGDAAAIAALGHDLFFDKRLSKGAVRACADCHAPDKAFSDGRRAPESLDPKQPLVRNTPTLLYAPLHAAQLWDGQFASAERQALKVIHADSEMGLSEDELVQVLRGVADYDARFSKLFDDGVSAGNVARALVAFEVRDLVPARSPFDRYAAGDDAALSDELQLGFDVFAGVGRCARCHIPPSFAGSRPTDFATPVYAALGVPKVPGGKELDSDPGRGKITRRPLDDHAFKTPTVRNVARTAPYFHHGGFETLEQVVDLYEKGGGRGLGMAVPNQDPEIRVIKLSDAERAALLAFMRVALLDP